MLFINWRRHYDVPNLVYYSNIFKRDRKAKFYFLSDTVFTLIHKYCFRRVIVNYLSYLFKKRWLSSCEKLTHIVSSNNRYNKRVLLIKRYRSKIFKKSISHVNRLFKYKWRIIYLKHILEESRINKLPLTAYFLNKLDNKQKLFNNKYIAYNTEKAIATSKTEVKIKRNSTNILYLLLILKDLEKCRLRQAEVLYTKINVVHKAWAILKNQFIKRKKNISTNQKKSILNNLKRWDTKLYSYHSKYTTLNTTILSVQDRKIQVNYAYEFKLTDDSKKRIDLVKKNKEIEKLTRVTTYSISFNLLKKQVSTALYYLILCSRRTVLQSNTVLNYYAFRDLKHRKYIFNSFKNNLYIFTKKLEDILWFQRKNFFKYLNSLFSGRQWLIGPTNKINLFRYITHLSFRIQDFFKLAHYRNRFFENSNLSFFYNTIKIRKDLLYKLGKKRYREEFILLNNNKWWVNYYIKYYYEVSRKDLLKYYGVMNKKYNIVLVRDLFVFLEYKIPVFLNKYVSYTFTNIKQIYLNNTVLNTNSNSFFYIGDYLKLEGSTSYYDKFLVFFNFIYFINPIKFKLKQQFLLDTYKKVFVYFTSYMSQKSSIISHTDKGIPFFTEYLYKLPGYLSKQITSKKLVLKSVLYLQNKYTQSNSLVNGNWNNTNYIKKCTSDFLLMYSFSKTVTAFKLMEFKAYFIQGRQKRIINRRGGNNNHSKYRKKYIYTFDNVYKWLYLKSHNTDLYKEFLSRSFDEKVHAEYFKNYNNLLENSDTSANMIDLIYKPNY